MQRADALLGDQFGAAARSLRAVCAESGAPLLLGGELPWTAGRVFAGAEFRTIVVPVPHVQARTAMWRHYLESHDAESADWAEDLATRFTLGEERIRQVVCAAEQRRTHRLDGGPLTLQDVAAACRDQADQNLGGLAVKVEPHYGWPDLVLSPPRSSSSRRSAIRCATTTWCTRPGVSDTNSATARV